MRASGSHIRVTRVTETGKHSVTVTVYCSQRVRGLTELAEVKGQYDRTVRATTFG